MAPRLCTTVCLSFYSIHILVFNGTFIQLRVMNPQVAVCGGWNIRKVSELVELAISVSTSTIQEVFARSKMESDTVSPGVVVKFLPLRKKPFSIPDIAVP
ncbi:hypothetical protein Pelo_12660 [Pelomyxa schiedti]|nr:hypothetical protein Pelo_12660 [Pelomyxa schiedti]